MSLIKSIPRSDATNVYDLLQDVKQAILEEPRRVNMQTYGRRINGESMMSYVQGKGYVKTQAPSCGTVGCFAGWVGLLTGYETWRIGFGGETAREILGRSLKFYFMGGKSGNELQSFFNAGGGDGISHLTPGTRAYARAVVKRINRFIDENGGKTVLKLQPVNREAKHANA